MRRVILALVLAIAVAGSAIAQPRPISPVVLDIELVNELALYLQFGGTRLQADSLLHRVVQAAQAPQKASDDEKKVQERIGEAVKAALANSTKPH